MEGHNGYLLSEIKVIKQNNNMVNGRDKWKVSGKEKKNGQELATRKRRSNVGKLIKAIK